MQTIHASEESSILLLFNLITRLIQLPVKQTHSSLSYPFTFNSTKMKIH